VRRQPACLNRYSEGMVPLRLENDMDANKRSMKAYQEKMRCKGCRFCDEKARAKHEPCCTYAFAILLQAGSCLTRLGKGEAAKVRRDHPNRQVR
jgi:hypothetical protein